MPETKDGPPFRAEHIGSLIRPPDLLAARDAFAAGRLDRAGLAAAEDEAIRGAVALQEAIGLKAVTDGEFRRATYSDSFTTSGISGVGVELTEEAGWSASKTHGDRLARRIPKVAGRFAPLDRLAISPQCGFATSRQFSLDIQKAKLARVVETAREVSGTA